MGTTHSKRRREKEKEDKEQDKEQENPDFGEAVTYCELN